ncbi:bacteriocin-like protein [Chryseobacterium oryctis]|uniref:Natural product n=1 Tax=Chryseobacterium oryctis TaxID=2952618 RepID=A0ABT3HSD2_9FLAO|nr:hypothetical protein [Chryseobacterium oryctis]MCW3162695.1 hypothetical protein [Chryseobacterium oryctis]
MKNLKKISREQLKNVKGGVKMMEALEDCSYKCCWDSQPNNCSGVITVSQQDSGTVSCTAGSHLVAV